MHTCPSCGQACYCCGDIEDHDTGDEFDCDHWLECESEDLIEGEELAVPSAPTFADGMTAEDDKRFNRQWDVAPNLNSTT